jgi:cold shock CspA family protein
MGYGFINFEHNGQTVQAFVHHEHIEMSGYRNLEEGQEVTADIWEKPDGRYEARYVELQEGSVPVKPKPPKQHRPDPIQTEAENLDEWKQWVEEEDDG